MVGRGGVSVWGRKMNWHQLVTVDGTDLIRLVAAFLAGLALGLEREYHDKSAGMRTITLICVGAALFVIVTQRIPPKAVARPLRSLRASAFSVPV